MPRERFPPGVYAPGHTVELEAFAEIFRCPAFRPEFNDCAVYAERPLDCRLYPFMLTYDKQGRKVFLGLDTYCPVIATHEGSRKLGDCVEEVVDLLDGELLAEVVASRGMVGEWKEHVHPLRELPGLTRALCRSDLGLARLTLTARDELQHFFAAQEGSLSYHALAPIYVWSGIFEIWWRIAGERLLIFAEAEGDCFLIAPPLGRGDIAGPAEEALATMRQLNPDAPSPRIQDADHAIAAQLCDHGWKIRESCVEYVYNRSELAALHGSRFKEKRHLCNRFEREQEWSWRPFQPDDLPAAIALYRTWLANRRAVHAEPFYVAQAEASFRSMIRALCAADELDLVARVLMLEEPTPRCAGFTIACPLHDGRSFHVLFEISDLTINGAAQFMYRQLCRELSAFELVNAGSASALPNLQRVKESYHPSARLPCHTLVPR